MDQLLSNYNGEPHTINAKEIIDFFTNKYPKVSTRDSKISSFKKQIMLKTIIPGFENGYLYNLKMRKQYKFPELLKEINNIKIDITDRIVLDKKQKDKHENNNTHSKTIPRETVDKLLKLLKSKNTYELFIGLLVACGRRSTEISGNGVLRRAKGQILFKGILKDYLNKNEEYAIVALVKPELLMKSYRRFKKETEFIKTPEEIQNFNNRSLKYLKNLLKIDITLHNLRSIYISYLFQYQNIEGLSKNWLVKNRLIHSDMGQTTNYNNFEIV